MSVSDKDHARRIVDGYRKATVDAGRSAESQKVFNAVTVVVAPTEAEARDLEEQCREYSDGEGNLAMLSAFIGQDLSKYGWDDPVEYVESDAMQSVLDAMTRYNGGRTVRVRDVATFSGLAGSEAYIVGSPSQVCDELISQVDDAGIDGFNLVRTIEPAGLRSFIELVVPQLQDRGRYKTECAGALGAGHPAHPALRAPTDRGGWRGALEQPAGRQPPRPHDAACPVRTGPPREGMPPMTTYRVDIDETLCNGYGNCVVAAPEVFDLDAETNIAVVQPGHPVEDDGPALREAEADCPVRAIVLHRT